MNTRAIWLTFEEPDRFMRDIMAEFDTLQTVEPIEKVDTLQQRFAEEFFGDNEE